MEKILAKASVFSNHLGLIFYMVSGKKPGTYFKTKALQSLKSLKITHAAPSRSGGCHVILSQLDRFQSRILAKLSMD